VILPLSSEPITRLFVVWGNVTFRFARCNIHSVQSNVRLICARSRDVAFLRGTRLEAE